MPAAVRGTSNYSPPLLISMSKFLQVIICFWFRLKPPAYPLSNSASVKYFIP